jgi:hypothetical protein
MSIAGVHWFWSLIALACIVWYSTVTIYIAYRGSLDIRSMLARLKDEQGDSETDVADS